MPQFSFLQPKALTRFSGAFARWLVGPAIACSLIAGCNIYSSSDRKSFNSNGATNTHQAAAAHPLSARTECQPIDNASSLLLRGVDIVHSSEGWNIEPTETRGTYRFIWARRSERADGVLCIIQPLSEYELQHTLDRLPSLASHLSAKFP